MKKKEVVEGLESVIGILRLHAKSSNNDSNTSLASLLFVIRVVLNSLETLQGELKSELQ